MLRCRVDGCDEKEDQEEDYIKDDDDANFTTKATTKKEETVKSEEVLKDLTDEESLEILEDFSEFHSLPFD